MDVLELHKEFKELCLSYQELVDRKFELITALEEVEEVEQLLLQKIEVNRDEYINALLQTH